MSSLAESRVYQSVFASLPEQDRASTAPARAFPDADTFDTNIGDGQFIKAVKSSNDALIPAPLELYLHIPFCKSLCYHCNCDKKVTRQQSLIRRYLDALQAEVQLKARLFDEDRVVTALCWGGGTPTYISAFQRATLMASLYENFNLSTDPSRHFVMEVDPRSVEPADYKELVSLGFNSINFGICDFNMAVQRAINRSIDYDAVAAQFIAARSAGIEQISVDLTYGLPMQTIESLSETIERLIDLGPDTVALSRYEHKPERHAAQRLIDASKLPHGYMLPLVLELLSERFDRESYEHLGLGQFARSTSKLLKAKHEGELRQGFSSYTPNASSEIIGIGASALSFVGDHYFQTEKDLPIYEENLADGGYGVCRGLQTTIADRRLSMVIQSLTCYSECNKKVWEREFGLSFDRYFSTEGCWLSALVNDGLLSVSTDEILVTHRGRLSIELICQQFTRSC